MNTLDMAVTNLAVIGSVIPEFGAVGGRSSLRATSTSRRPWKASSVSTTRTRPPKRV